MEKKKKKKKMTYFKVEGTLPAQVLKPGHQCVLFFGSELKYQLSLGLKPACLQSGT